MPFFRLSVLLLLVVCTLSTGCNSPSTPEEYLAQALRRGRLKDVKKLVDQGVDVKQRFGDDDSTALHIVARSINVNQELGTYLVEQGVDVNAKNSEGVTAWELIWNDRRGQLYEKKGLFLVELLKGGYEPGRPDGKNGETFLHTVAKFCKCALLMKMLAAQGDIEARDQNGWTPLHYAAFEGNYESADGLLLAGADPNAETTVAIKNLTPKYQESEGRQYLYDAGSRPMDLYHESFTRNTKDFKSLMIKHGGSKNPEIKNIFTIGYGIL